MDKDVIQSVAAIGERLRAARLTTGLSARTVADKLHALGHSISHATLCNYEIGKTAPEYPVVEALAQIYERPVDWILDQGPLISRARYRCLKSVRVAEKRRFEGEALGWLRAFLAVEKLVDLKNEAWAIKLRPEDTGKVAAEKVRKMLPFGNYPFPSICRTLVNFGIRVIQLATRSRIDGLAGWLGDVPIVVVNSELSNDRMRMNLAHELGHHLFEDCMTGGRLSEDEVETRAKEFASHLLIPDEWLDEAFSLKSMVQLVQFKERFGVSLAAMIYRARQKKLLSAVMYQRLWREFARLGWRQKEPGYVQPDRPGQMEMLFDAAMIQKKTTLRDIARLAGVEEEVVKGRIHAAAGGGFPHSSEGGVINIETLRHDDTKE